MDASSHLSKAKCILLAVGYAVDSDITALQQLTASSPNKLSLDIILRILLTFLPESTEPSTYVPFLRGLISGQSSVDGGSSLDLSAVENVSEDDARARVRRLRLLPLRYPETTMPTTADALTTFLDHRAHRIDAQTGLLTTLPQLIIPFLGHSEDLRIWFISKLLPVLRHNYEYYGNEGSELLLTELEHMDEVSAIRKILSQARTKGTFHSGPPNVLARDLRGLVGPWVYGEGAQKRRKLNHDDPPGESQPATSEGGEPDVRSPSDESDTDMGGWYNVFSWLLSTATDHFAIVVEAIENWDGPRDIDLGGYGDIKDTASQTPQRDLDRHYLQAALGVIYAAPDASSESLTGVRRVLSKIERFMKYDPPLDLRASFTALPAIETDFTGLAESSRRFLLPDTALQAQNPFLTPEPRSLLFLHALWLSASLLNKMKYGIDLKGLADLCLFATEEIQREHLRRCVRTFSNMVNPDERGWIVARKNLLWLWRWGREKDPVGSEAKDVGLAQGVFGRVERAFVEAEVLKALLNNLHHQIVIETYLRRPGEQGTLSPEEVEQAVVNAAMGFYDHASNCNRTRGEMKKASETIKAFYPDQFPRSRALARADKLVAATHALSFYALTLQHGVPFRPVTIRAHQDPISLIGKILEQNRRSYVKLDDLLNIGRNLIEAGLVDPKIDSAGAPSVSSSEIDLVRTVERRITGMAIEAALSEDDFEAAYRYVITRLPIESSRQDKKRDLGPGVQQEVEDDTSWRAAFQAGRYRPTSSPTTASGSDKRGLEMRLELLSRALLLAPPAALTGILAAWRQSEENLNVLLAQEAEEEEGWDGHHGRRTSGPSLESSTRGIRKETSMPAGEEAPMGLFDVAKGAAAALSKSAFPLRGPGDIHRASEVGSDSAEHDRAFPLGGSGSHEDGRARKRDVVSNLVTGGLASGLGWVLGAPPTQPGPPHG